MSVHNLWFGAKIRKIAKPLHTPVLLYKSGVQGVYNLHGNVFVMVVLSHIGCLWTTSVISYVPFPAD